jgi:hypothetical protein
MIFVSVAFSSFTFDYRISHFISGRMSVNPNVLPGLRHDSSYLFRGIPCVFANIFIFLRPSCDRLAPDKRSQDENHSQLPASNALRRQFEKTAPRLKTSERQPIGE